MLISIRHHFIANSSLQSQNQLVKATESLHHPSSKYLDDIICFFFTCSIGIEWHSLCQIVLFKCCLHDRILDSAKDQFDILSIWRKKLLVSRFFVGKIYSAKASAF